MMSFKSVHKIAWGFAAMLSLQLSLPAFGQQYNGSNPAPVSTSRVSSAHSKAEKNASITPSIAPDYVIGSEDVLAITVWKEPELSHSVPVRPDGKITMPLIGDIMASGLTAKQLQDSIETQLKSYIDNPQVAVSVQEIKAQQYNLLGEVARPGAFPLDKPTTVLDAIAQGGGFRDFAKTNKIYILRTGPSGTPQRIKFNYKQVIKGEKFQQNVAILPGDTIVVP
jgi:polysaccharide biosynthesis/export protein